MENHPAMTGKPDPDINWELTTWKGSRLQQHREFHALPFARKLELVEEMCEMARQFGGKATAAQSPSVMRETPTACKSAASPPDQPDKPKSPAN
jgi:hypothetical protein